MSIVKMSRLRFVAPKSVRKGLLRELTRLGCVQIDSSAALASDPEWSGILQPNDESGEARAMLAELKPALATLAEYAPAKKPFLSPRRYISERDFYDKPLIDHAVSTAEKIVALNKEIIALQAERGRVSLKRASLLPWIDCPIALDASVGKSCELFFGVCSSSTPFEHIATDAESSGECELTLVNSDREQHYLIVLLHRAAHESVLAALRTYGFSFVQFKDLHATARENVADAETRMDALSDEISRKEEEIRACAPERSALEQAFDALTLEARRDEILASLSATKKTVFMQGWAPTDTEAAVSAVLEDAGCAYEFTSPEEGDTPPVLLHNAKLVAPFSMVTELYALPTYESQLDPNPLMSPFFFIFFGLMMADTSYGILIALGSYIALKRMRPPESGMIARLLKVGVLCGISTFIWGILFGSYFGDIIPVLSKMATGVERNIPPLLFDPMAEPMTLFIMSLAFGVIQIFFGMGVKVYQLIRTGHAVDALCDIIFWYPLVGGLLWAIVTWFMGGNLTPCLITALIGALGVLFTGGRAKKGFFGKLIGGLGSLYGIANYLSDILSYSRLLALCLATAVIAKVMNTMSVLGGNTVGGWILFVAVFTIGHVFNVGINLLGTFVHTSRLQYIEFFGKFYEPGGKPFKPLFYKTKYVEIIREEN